MSPRRFVGRTALTLLLVALGPAWAFATFPDFAAPISHLAGTAPRAVVRADLNADGRPDLAVANFSSNTISILLGTGGGGFQTAVNYAGGGTPTALAAADLNGDGKLDLAVANSALNTVSVLLGNGDGTFGAPNSYAAGSSPQSVAIGNLNGDSKLDLAVANGGDSTVSILAGNGDGTFGAAANFTIGASPSSVAIADVNGDSRPDVAVANAGSGSVSILIANGTGSFLAAVSYGVGTSPASVAIGDVNADSIPDLAVANSGSDNVSILIGAADGSFAAAVNYAAGGSPKAVVIGDLNADGKPDLAVANSTTGNVSTLRGNGDGTFQAAIDYGVGKTPFSLVIGDVNGDGRVDLSVALNGSNNVSILRGNADFTFKAILQSGAGTTPSAVAGNDFNGDGKSDLAVANSGSNNVSILIGNGNGTFAAPVNYTVGTSPKSVAIGDFNGDAKLDLAVANSGSNNVSILLGNGDGTFGAATNFAAGTSPSAVAVGDFNANGSVDLAVANSGSANVSILLGNGNGTFAAAVNNAAGTTPSAVAIADFNADARLDLAVANSGSNNVSILLGNGNGTFAAAVNNAVGTAPSSVAIADVDADGKRDLVVANRSSANVSILRGNGNGTFVAAVNYTVNKFPQFVAVADVDADGKLDLAVANQGFNTVSILTGNGDATFGAQFDFSVPDAPSGLVFRDFNVDGSNDLAVATASGSVAILLNTPAPDLSVTVSHVGNFRQGQSGATYTITVTNQSTVATSGTVTLTDQLGGLGQATGLSGGGWTCTLGTLTCTRSDALAGGSSYPAVTVTVKVFGDAPASITNTARVSGGEVNGGNDTATDATTVTPMPDLLVTKSHSGNFSQGQTGATYTLTVFNVGGGATTDTVVVTDSLPAGLTATAMSGSGWSCTLDSRTCQRSDPLSAGATYAPITVTVSVAGNAPATVTNTAIVSAGGELNVDNDRASDPTTVTQVSDLTLTKTHTGNFTRGQTGATYTLTVSNVGAGSASGTVTLTDTLPSGLTATDLSGSGWSCALASVSCTRSDALAPGASYPAVTLTVTVAGNAPATVTNTASVSGGADGAPANNDASDPTTVTPGGTAPAITTQPESRTITEGQSTSFSVAAGGTPAPAFQWQVSTDGGSTFTNLADGSPYSGTATATLTIATPPVSLNGARYRAVATNASGSATSAAATLTVNRVPATMALDLTSLNFSAMSDGTAFVAQTAAQQVRLTQSGFGPVTWTATSSQPWLTVSPASGSGSATLTIGTRFVANLPANSTGTVTITLTGSTNTVGPITVTLRVLSAADATAPVGAFETPIDQSTGVTGSIAVTGWALDDIEVTELQIWRDPHPSDPRGAIFAGPAPQGGKVFIGFASFVPGARPDVQSLYPAAPLNSRAGWGYLLLTRGLVWDGKGAFRLYAIAKDRDGHTVQIGAKTITIDNSTATKPFGAIDTPAQGGTASGMYPNTGWVLTPNAGATIPATGVQVTIDGAFLPGVPSMSDRSDITAGFPGFNTSGAGRGLFVDTTQFANGPHVIGWMVTDSTGKADGVGSRFFTISNGALRVATGEVAAARSVDVERLPPSDARVTGRRGFDRMATFDNLRTGTDGTPSLQAEALDRIEVRLDEGTTDTYAGYLRVGDRLTPLPIGSHVSGSTFTWQAGPAFLGGYDLVFVRERDGTAVARQELRITIVPQGTLGR
jgi:uncharacterized repeat protein (TIGR01451 family)